MKKRLTYLDSFILLALLAFAAFVIYRLAYGLNYQWDWSIIPTYLIRFDQEKGHWVANVLLQGLFTTIRLSIWGTLMAVLLGLIIGLMRVADRLFFRLCSRTYVELIRNLPPLVLIFIFYFFFSDQLFFWLQPDSSSGIFIAEHESWMTFLFAPPSLLLSFFSGIITLGLFQGAYMAEIIRAGIQSIDYGQTEAARALGMNRWQQMRYIILPQAVRRMLAPLANEFINTIKYSAIVSIISIQELTFQGMQVMASTQVTIEVWITISLMYFILCFFFSCGVQYLENK